MTFAVPDELSEAWAILFATKRQFAAFIIEAPLPLQLGKVGTACTTGKAIICDPKFFENLTYEQQAFVVGHEVVHVWYQHCQILKAWKDAGQVAGLPFDLDTAQQALDHIVNDTLFRFGFSLDAFPKEGIHNPALIDWMTGEDEAYARLYQQQAGAGSGQDAGRGGQSPGQAQARPGKQGPTGTGPVAGPGSGQPGRGGHDVVPAEAEGVAGDEGAGDARGQMVLRRLLQSVDPSSLRGTAPGDFERLVERLTPTHVDWRSAVDRRLRAVFGRGKWSWERPRARALAMGTVLPGRTGKRAGTLVVACDTSGSIGAGEIQRFLGGCWELIAQVAPRSLWLLEVDAKVQRAREIKSAHEFKSVVLRQGEGRLKGGGGTDMRKVFAWLEEKQIKPDQVLIFSDLETPFPARVPCKTLWVSSRPGKKAPEGAGDTVGFKM